MFNLSTLTVTTAATIKPFLAAAFDLLHEATLNDQVEGIEIPDAEVFILAAELSGSAEAFAEVTQ